MIPKLLFGRSGHMSTRTLFGGAAAGRCTEQEADQIPDLLLEYGVNHIDTASSYGDSELHIGRWIGDYRGQFFLATKAVQRTYQMARDEFHRSLDRLRVDHVDLLQLHNLTDPKEWDIAMGPAGALEAAIEAREQGLVRFLGVTGHGMHAPAMHLRSLEKLDFDSVLLPYNYVMMSDPEYAAGFAQLLGICRQRNVAAQTIKSLARRPWDDNPKTRNTWYEPLEDQADVDRAVHWVLGNPGVFLNTAGDLNLLPKILDAAGRFQETPPEDEMAVWATEREMATIF